jgi:hypothetical protein
MARIDPKTTTIPSTTTRAHAMKHPLFDRFAGGGGAVGPAA